MCVCVCVWGGGYNWDIKIFNATNCERRSREATLSECFGKMKVIVALISVSSHPLYTVHAQNI